MDDFLWACSGVQAYMEKLQKVKLHSLSTVIAIKAQSLIVSQA